MALAGRHFYRCRDCLAVFVLEGKCAPTCGACGATYARHMGKVLTCHPLDVPGDCDARCRNARGPSCDCSCGGENHGAGLVVPVAGVVAEVEASAERLEVALAWRKQLAEAERSLKLMQADSRLARSAWRVADLIAKAREMTSKKRLELLAKAVELEGRLVDQVTP